MENTSVAKSALRAEILAARRTLAPDVLRERAEMIGEAALGMPEIQAARTVAAYVSVGTEPGTGLLLDALLALGKHLLLPVLLPDNDLDWAAYDGTLRTASRGLLEPTTPPLGVDAVAAAEVVIVPAVAVSRDGWRLGRGGGSYDRALVRASGFTVAAIYREEVLAAVPCDAHDQRVHAVATPDGVLPIFA